jgi:hypothetical protein
MGYIVSRDSLNFGYRQSWKHYKFSVNRGGEILFIVSEHFTVKIPKYLPLKYKNVTYCYR